MFITSEILLFVLLIGRTTFFTSETLSFVFRSTNVGQNLMFIGQKFDVNQVLTLKKLLPFNPELALTQG